MNIKDIITLIALALAAACDPASLQAKVAPDSTACAGSALVGTKSSDVTETRASASCKLILDDLDGGCKLVGTFSDMNLGQNVGTAWYTIEEASDGCGIEAPHSFELTYEIDGDSIAIGFN